VWHICLPTLLGPSTIQARNIFSDFSDGRKYGIFACRFRWDHPQSKLEIYSDFSDGRKYGIFACRLCWDHPQLKLEIFFQTSPTAESMAYLPADSAGIIHNPN